jgi:hypothetical protein
MPKANYENLKTAKGEELVPNQSRLVRQNTIELVRKIEKKLPPAIIKHEISSGFTSSETQKKSSDETKVSRLETIYERSRDHHNASLQKKSKFDEDSMSHSALFSQHHKIDELSYSGSSIEVSKAKD